MVMILTPAPVAKICSGNIMTWRDVKNQARKTLHQTMQIPAFYFTSLPINSDAEPVEINVRVHSSNKALGDHPGTSYQFAERREGVTALVFLREELMDITLDRANIIVLTADEAYEIDNVHPTDGITTMADVSRVSASDLVGVPYPGEDSDG